MLKKISGKTEVKFHTLLLITAFMFVKLVSVAQVNNKAARFLEMEQYNQAKAAYISQLKTAGNAADWYYLGKIYSIQNNPDSAQYCFSKASEKDPKSVLILVGQAISENMGGNNSQALLTLDKAQRSAISSKDINAMAEIAEVRYNAGDSLKWPLTLDLASGIDKKNPRPYITAGNLDTGLGDKSNRSQY